MDSTLIEKHYRANRAKHVKWLTFKSGSPEAAEDIIQEAYFRALKYYGSYRAEDDFNRWFSRIVLRCLIDYMNAEKGHTDEEFVEELTDGTSCTQYTDHVMRDVFDLIGTKSLVQQEVLGMYFRLEYTAKDISQITEYSYAMCHKIISRFREELRTLYDA